jgi:16S rRNA (adenine1518-N6/adenine1519-N6)-dimethyltransferase
MTLLVQKEVAERIVAKDGKESLLSLSVKAYGEPKLVEKVPRGAFAPAPEVDSAIIHISNISKNNFYKFCKGSLCENERDFFDLIHAGFAHKRKQILPRP